MKDVHISRVDDVRLQWGESPHWDDTLQRLYFVDCATRRFMWLDPLAKAQVQFVELPSLPTAVYLTTDNDRVLVQLSDGLHTVSPSVGALMPSIAMPPGEGPFNDGVVDTSGAIVTGSLLFGLEGMPATGSYWRYSPAVGWAKLHEGKGNTNGPCVSADGQHLYVADTTAGLIFRFNYHASGRLDGEMLFADTSSLGGRPDGATLDADGCLWSAIVGGACIAQFAPDGRLKRVVHIPASHPTSVAFGDQDLENLYVTTIGANLFGIEPKGELSGALLKIEGLGSRGVVSSRYRF